MMFALLCSLDGSCLGEFLAPLQVRTVWLFVAASLIASLAARSTKSLHRAYFARVSWPFLFQQRVRRSMQFAGSDRKLKTDQTSARSSMARRNRSGDLNSSATRPQ